MSVRILRPRTSLRSRRLATMRPVYFGERFVAEFVRELDERRGIGNALLVADAAEPAPSNRVGDFGDEGFVAELIAELEIHHPQVSRDRYARAAEGFMEVAQRMAP